MTSSVKAHLVSPSVEKMSVVFRIHYSSRLTDGDVVVVVNGNQVAQLQVASHRSSLASNTLHGAAITEEGICVVVEQLKVGLVENTAGVGLSNGETHSVGETLAQGTGGHLNTGGIVSLGVTGGNAVKLLMGEISDRLLEV